jgi:hypothetical protein
MSGPWEEYAAQAPAAGAAERGPWDDYGSTSAAVPSPAKSTIKSVSDLPRLAGAKSAPAPLSRMDKALQGVRDPLDGGAQLLTNLLPKGLVEAGNRANNWLADKTGLVARLPEGGIDQQVRASNHEYEARRKAAGETGIDGYRALGGFIPSAILTAATGGAGAGLGLAGRVGLGAVQGAASGALAPAAGPGDYWSEKANQVALGAGVGAAMPAAFGAAARVISPNASRNPNLALLRKEGVTPTIGQALGGISNRIEEKFVSAPLLGDAIRAGRNRADGEFQAAAVNRSLAPVGDALPRGVTGREAITYAENSLRQKYDDVLTNIGAIPADQQFSSKLANLGSMVNRDVLSRDAKTKFGTILSDVQGAFDQNGILTSEGFKRVESQLGSDFRTLSGAKDIYDNRLAPAVKQLQSELRDLLRRQAGSAAGDLQAVNAGWANFKRAQNATSKLGADEGEFTAAQFNNAVRALDKSKDKGAFARGSALGQDLGDAGKAILTNKIPNSGTADRLMNAGALGSYFVNPAIPLTALGGAGLYLPPIQRALVGAVGSRPAAAQPAANALRNAGPMFIPGLTQLLLNKTAE